MKLEPDSFSLEETTIWSFPDRGNWATHSGQYRGNWSPYVPRNLILRYSNPGDWILDQFVGSGTTLVEAKLLGRNAIGIDINPAALNLSKHNIDFHYDTEVKTYLRRGDARDLSFLKNESIQLICTHPPYADIIRYSDNIPQDMSQLEYDNFIENMEIVAKESFRVLRKNSICAYMMGDIRQKGLVKPLGMDSLQIFLKTGFLLKEIIIKEQHNCRSSEYWAGRGKAFLMLAHEYIFVLLKA